MDVEQFRKQGYQAIDRICDYYYSMQSRPVRPSVEPGYLRKLLPESAPVTGEDFQAIADDYHNLIVPGLTHWQHPSFFAYFPTPCTFEGILGDLYASSAANPGFNWSASPACTELEAVVMDWAGRMLGLGPAFRNTSGIGGGCIQTTASDSALVSVVAARARYQRTYPDARLEDLIIYTTTQTHSLGVKAGRVLGLTVRALPVTHADQYALRGKTLRAALEEDTYAGRRPFVLIATVGTTSSGAIDNMTEVGEVARDYPSLWIHVDAAWAGVAFACPEYRIQGHLAAINAHANSFCTNFHKWGLVNFDASALWVRDRRDLTEALDVTPPFLRTAQGDAGTAVDYRNWHLALSRRFRSLKMWFVLRSFGVEGMQKYIRRTIALNNVFADLVARSSQLTLVTPPSLALTVFRLAPRGAALSLASLNTLNRRLFTRISARDDILLTQTELNGVFCIRVAVGSPHTTDTHIRNAFALLSREAEHTLAASSDILEAPRLRL